MWTVLLVEDEVFVRESIKEIIRWEELGFQVIGEAGDGAEAFELIQEHRPDLVLSDIIMPRMDGVELLKSVRGLGIDSRFIMLSCMSDFEYVRSAMEFGASNYILKLSMSVKSLKDALEKMNKELAERRQTRAPEIDSNELYRKAWERYFDSRDGMEHPELGVVWKRYTHAAIFTLLTGSHALDVTEFLDMGLTSSGGRELVHSFSHMGQATVFVWSVSPIKLNSEAVKRSAYPMVYSSSVFSDQWAEAWSRVLHAADRLWYSGKTEALLSAVPDTTSLKPVPSATECLTWELEREFAQAFEQAWLQECRAIMERLWRSMEAERVPFAIVKKVAIAILTLCSRISGNQAVSKELVYHETNHRSLGSRLMEEIERNLDQWIKSKAVMTDHPEINKIIAYLNQYYDRDLTVKSLATQVAMDENYISSLFKKKTGETITHYLQKVRVEKAAYYLVNSDLQVSEIGTRVGFANDNYFIKIFKRWMSMTPQMYRRMKQTN